MLPILMSANCSHERYTEAAAFSRAQFDNCFLSQELKLFLGCFFCEVCFRSYLRGFFERILLWIRKSFIALTLNGVFSMGL